MDWQSKNYVVQFEGYLSCVSGRSEYELKNFFSAAGINMGNVQTTEQTIVKIITDMLKEGWELYNITSTALNTDTKRQGIFITRHLFRRQIK